MRRIAITLGCVLLFGSFASAAAGPLGQIYTVDHLEGDWVYDSGSGAPRWYLVQADIVTDVETGEIVTSRARGGVGRCSDNARHCWLSPIETFKVVSYEADLLFRNVHLAVRRTDGTGKVARLDFTAGNVGGNASDSIHPCPGEADLHSDIGQSARATGVFFGRRVSSATDLDRTAEQLQREIYTC